MAEALMYRGYTIEDGSPEYGQQFRFQFFKGAKDDYDGQPLQHERTVDECKATIDWIEDDQ